MFPCSVKLPQTKLNTAQGDAKKALWKESYFPPMVCLNIKLSKLALAQKYWILHSKEKGNVDPNHWTVIIVPRWLLMSGLAGSLVLTGMCRSITRCLKVGSLWKITQAVIVQCHLCSFTWRWSWPLCASCPHSVPCRASHFDWNNQGPPLRTNLFCVLHQRYSPYSVVPPWLGP